MLMKLSENKIHRVAGLLLSTWLACWWPLVSAPVKDLVQEAGMLSRSQQHGSGITVVRCQKQFELLMDIVCRRCIA